MSRTTYGPFERETVLDLLVNVIPIGILLFFTVLLLVGEQWAGDLFMLAVTIGLILIPIVSLVILSYVAGQVIQRDENQAREVS